MAVKTGDVVVMGVIGVCIGALFAIGVKARYIDKPGVLPSDYVAWQMVEPGTFVQHDKQLGIVCLGTGNDLDDMFAKQTYRCEKTK